MGMDACADDEGDVALTGPLQDLPGRVGFTRRTGDAAGDDSAAVGNRLTAAEVADVVDVVGEILPGGATAGIEFTLIESSTWPTGFCSDGTVTNTTADPIVWEARAEITGTITSIWSANYTIDGDEHVFTGVDWNAELGPFGSTTFGFCGER